MVASCFEILSSSFFANLNTSISNATTAEELQEIIDKAFEQLSYLESNITSQMAYIEPIAALLTAPSADLAKIVTWITTLINNVLKPMYAPYTIYVTQIAQITAEVATITALINEVKDAKFPDVTITIPSVSVICKL